MEPTLSAATKTAKKKILAERNQAFTFTNSSKPPILDSRTSPARSVRSSCSSDYDEDEENSFDGNTVMITAIEMQKEDKIQENAREKQSSFNPCVVHCPSRYIYGQSRDH